MAYYPDLTPYDYSHRDTAPGIVNVGWLDKAHDYTRGIASEFFIRKLWAFCRSFVNPMRGFHSCELCTAIRPGELLEACHYGESLKLGFAEIRVIGKDNRIYAAPNMIYHYVVEHNYSPPDEFIQAVLDSPLPGDKAFEEVKQQRNWYGWWK